MRGTLTIVYVVDDDASSLTAISRLLRASGFSVKAQSSAPDFFAHLDLQSALAQGANPLPILFLTGDGDIPSSVPAMPGAKDFLEKTARVIEFGSQRNWQSTV